MKLELLDLESLSSFNFFGPGHSYHSIFVSEKSSNIVYKILNLGGTVNQFTIFEAYCNQDYDNSLQIILNSPFSTVWLYMEINPHGENYSYLVGTDFLEKYKEQTEYLTDIAQISQLLKKATTH